MGRIGSALLGLLGLALVGVVVIGGLASAFSYRAVDPGFVGVVQKGGPFDSRGIAGFKDPGSGPSFIGPWNHLREFPSTQRNYIISSNPEHGDRAGYDKFCTPTADAVNVCIEGQALFTLNTEHEVLTDFYRRYGLRTFQGKHPFEGDEGWLSFLEVQFRPVLENALRQEVGRYDCEELNSACQLVKGTEAESKDTVQNISKVQTEIGETLAEDLTDTLKGEFFINVQFRLQQIGLPEKVAAAVDDANAAKAQVAQQRYLAQAADQKAKAAQSLAKAYQANPYAGLTEFAKALCGSSSQANGQQQPGAAAGGCSPIINLSLGGSKSPTLSVGR